MTLSPPTLCLLTGEVLIKVAITVIVDGVTGSIISADGLFSCAGVYDLRTTTLFCMAALCTAGGGAGAHTTARRLAQEIFIKYLVAIIINTIAVGVISGRLSRMTCVLNFALNADQASRRSAGLDAALRW